MGYTGVADKDTAVANKVPGLNLISALNLRIQV